MENNEDFNSLTEAGGLLFSSIAVLFVVSTLRLVVADVQSFFSGTSFSRISKWSGNDNRFFLEMKQAEGPENSLACSRKLEKNLNEFTGGFYRRAHPGRLLARE
ncbi:MAG TPA: hypothetical protein VNN20_03105 [Thermodesulfobacteriota bacterium]|nr:hypothetical protein [Thermodesulfobacteriota bacterium]